VFAAALLIAGCCGGGPNHKCDFTPPNESAGDGGSDAPMHCGTAVCEPGQACCFRKAPAVALCVDPASFDSLGCETPGVPCFTPADCPADTTCCLNIADVNNLIVNCQARLLCPGNGADTRIACGSEADCPLVAPSCNVVGKAMGVDFKICSPGSD
jgi:hypothetical protein